MDAANFFSAAKNFFREDTSEIVGAYFDGETIFLVRLTDTFDTAEISADGEDFAQLAEKISVACRERGWQTQNVGYCLRERDAVTYQSEMPNVPEKDFPALVKTWSQAQAGIDAANSFAQIDGRLWMETLPRSTADEICATFRKFDLNLTALSVMPSDLLAKITPFDHARFIAEVAEKKTSPNLLRQRTTLLDVQKISAAVAVIFLVAALVTAIQIFESWYAAGNEFDAAKLAVNNLRDDIALKNFFDEDIGELQRLNNLTVAQAATKTFNALINFGKVVSGDVHLTSLRVDENFAEINGRATNSDAVKSCLARVKKSVTSRARTENSSTGDDGEIIFAIRADFKAD